MIWPTDDAGIVGMLLEHEGSEYTNDPADVGGPTKFGVTLRELAEWRGVDVTPLDVASLTREEASQIFQRNYIIRPGFDQISSIALRAALADAAVLFGPLSPTLALQAICGVLQDGELGPKTAASANVREPRGVINLLSVWRIRHHLMRVRRDASQLEFLDGWCERAIGFIT